jgi:phosphoglycolate phosphatase-like HAD superfamily hydrolase
MTHTEPLKNFQPAKEFFVGIDSDGCAFDTMEIKHKECFIPNIIKYWGLQAVSKYAREAAEFVNLYSKWRGINRWPALVKVFELLQERPEVIARHARLPQYKPLADFAASGRPLSNAGVKQMLQESGDPIYERALRWSEAVNTTIDEMVEGVPPFPFVRESLEDLFGKADIIVVSATPTRALNKEWAEHDIARYARLIAGQEMGTKKEHLALAAKGRYAQDHILMIGDALGDMQAARSIGALFYPINPGNEDCSWQRFHEEAAGRFFSGAYAGAYEAGLIEEFNRTLPELPPWKTAARPRVC